jgi:hypothetical protein
MECCRTFKGEAVKYYAMLYSTLEGNMVEGSRSIGKLRIGIKCHSATECRSTMAAL